MKNKSYLNKLKKDYFKVPNKIHRVGLSVPAIAIYSYLAMHSEEFNPPISVIAEALRISKTTTVKYMKELKDRNIIKCYYQGSGGFVGTKKENKTSRYEFVSPGDWI